MKQRKGKLKLELGIKSDPIEYRYSFEWLFSLMQRMGIRHLQLGSFFELYHLDDGYFLDLRELAATYEVRISSVFTAHRELGGFFAGDPRMEQVARRSYERLIRVASLLGARYVGSNPGAVYRDRMDEKAQGISRYISHLEELSALARSLGIEALTIEPMSCLAEPPTTPGEIRSMMTDLSSYHTAHPDSTVPFYLCGDISHGYADSAKSIIYSNFELFEYAIPWMCEFHIKNTNAIFGSTFGFTSSERNRGVVDIGELMGIVKAYADVWPVDEVVGYLEIGGPKLGRDYSDHLLGGLIAESIAHLQEAMR
jgi:ribulose-phosphate 3-epimerase